MSDPTQADPPGDTDAAADPADPDPGKRGGDLGYHPAFGCIIGITALLIFSGLGVFSFYVLSAQNSAIASFAHDGPAEIAVATPTPEESAALMARLTAYRDAAKDFDTKAELRLSPDDLDALIASSAQLDDYRGMVDFVEIEPGADDGGARVFADISLPIRRMRFWEGPRYLVGRAEFVLVRADGSIHFYITEIDTGAGTPVTEGFLENFRHWLWLVPFQDDPEVAPALTNTHSITVEDGAVVLSTRSADEGISPAD